MSDLKATIEKLHERHVGLLWRDNIQEVHKKNYLEWKRAAMSVKLPDSGPIGGDYRKESLEVENG